MNDELQWPDTITNDKGSRRPFSPRSAQAPLSALISRRQLLLGAAGGAFLGASGNLMAAMTAAGGNPSTLRFQEINLFPAPDDRLPPGYRRQILLRWGDPLFSDAPPFAPGALTAAASERQFGYNNDYTVWMPLPQGSGATDHGLLIVNHEYPIPQLMFSDLQKDTVPEQITREQVDVCMAAVGISVAEVRRGADGQWQLVLDGPYNRRITAKTPMRISGPAAGHPKLRTSADPEGRSVLGTHDNCNGGVTPWGTILSGEEGSSDFFGGTLTGHPDEALFRRYHYEDRPIGSDYGWPRFHERFRVDREPNEANRFEWVVEFDPLDPTAPPVKRTALGRFAHEGAHCTVAPDGRVVVHLGDDWDFEYCYRFVSRQRFNPHDRAANRDLLDDGTLSVARFNEDGTLDWLPLVQGKGPLTEANGFATQGDVLINTRRAADLLGATPVDGPEGYETNPLTGRVYVALTGGVLRTREQVNVAVSRVNNRNGHILELTPPDHHGKPDPAADRYRWDVFVLCGDPKNPRDQAQFHPQTSNDGWFVEPDNIAFDPQGRIWVCSDGPGPKRHDGVWAMDTAGPGRALPRLFYCPPNGAECCSPAFTRDGRTMFLSVQHPSELSPTEDAVVTRWPDFQPGVPPRPSLIVITREDGGVIGN